MVTAIVMSSRKLTKEMNPQGKEKLKKSVHDDYENFIENLRFGESICQKDTIPSYFLPKFTEEKKTRTIKRPRFHGKFPLETVS